MCIFCDIVKGQIPAYKLYEDEDVLAFLDISQVTKGHTLVIPKKHYDDFLTCDEAILQKLTLTAQKLGAHIMEKTGANGMHLLSNAKEAAGQSVPHVHLHLIPRWSEQDACVITFKESDAQDMDALCALLKMDEAWI